MGGLSRQKRLHKLADIGELFEAIDEIDQRVAGARTKWFLRIIEAASEFREMLLAREAARWIRQQRGQCQRSTVASFNVTTTSCGTKAFGSELPSDKTTMRLASSWVAGSVSSAPR